ncbi:acyloxyacyl hydrolase [Desulforhopalus sp. IMCC35007]|nr:acyloxyacyl hydrolase [Desulforhopalus sp. IMCC35007]
MLKTIMKVFKGVMIGCAFSMLAGSSASSTTLSQLGLGYGKEFRGNKDISQFELYYRHPLSYKKKLGDVWNLSTALEFGGAVIDEQDSENSSTGRLSLMPQIMLSPNDAINVIVGIGTGFMMGETEFTDHNLGGPFFFSSKVGFQLVLGKHLGLEYNFYHQSNAGIYDYNASLNMHCVSLSYQF